MGRLEKWSLVVLLWTTAALATSLVPGPISRRTAGKCPSKYTSQNGLNFTTYCDQNNPFNDAMDPFTSDSMEDCMEHCSRYWDDGEGCFGIVWREDNQCWIRNSSVSIQGLTNETNTHSALVDRLQLKGYDTDCPAPDLSVQTHPDVSGLGYTVHCNKNLPGYDTCWRGYPSCNNRPFQAFYHATSLEDCLQKCVDEHPLCRAAAYFPGGQMRFANCWPKTGFGGAFTAPASNQGTIHTATITSLDTINTTCPESNTYTATGSNKNFNIQCGKLNGGSNITSLHTQNVTACMDTCANSTQNCVAIVFDSSLQGGYNNCYLQNTTSVISDQVSSTYAVVSVSVSVASPSSSKSSKAWIAGPVVGGIAGLGLIGAVIFWWRRRNSVDAAATAEADGVEKKEAPPNEGGQTANASVPQHAETPSELMITQRHELDGTVECARELPS